VRRAHQMLNAALAVHKGNITFADF